jgi:Tfp pilus assembly protein PilF
VKIKTAGFCPPFFLFKGKFMTIDKKHQSQQQFRQLLGQLFAAVNRHDPAAMGKIRELLKKVPEEPNLLHLAGLASADQNDLPAAIDYLMRSLGGQPGQSEVHNNLANIYARQGDIRFAEEHYRQAVSLQPNLQNAWKNLGLLLLETEPMAALHALSQAVELAPQDVSALTGLGDAYKALEDYVKAKNCYQQVLSINPHYVNALHNLALCYKQNDELALAIAGYEQALALAPDSAEIHYNYANALFETGDNTRAESEYLTSLEKNPGFVLAHETLHELYWQAGQHDRLEHSYQQAITIAPRDMALRLSYINVLIAVGRDEAAQQQLGDALAINTTAALLHAQGRLAANRVDYDAAQTAFTRALGQTFDLTIAQDLARLHISQGKYDLAQRVIDRILVFAPHNQLNWALQSLCWRLGGDARYQWLNDYQRHIQAFTLPTPAGYGNLVEFLAELEVVLLGMHQAQSAPSRQTLKLGTQTPGRLLHKSHPVIGQYKAALAEVIEGYLSHLPRDDTHPFLKRLPANVGDHFEFSGSWSVRLKPQGFHVNHVHPEGWVSSACYITLPETMRGEGAQTDNAGCIKFGESALMLGDREVVERVIRPEAGQLVLFPSYTWHGTYAFEGGPTDFRLTAPFDVVPIEG